MSWLKRAMKGKSRCAKNAVNGDYVLLNIVLMSLGLSREMRGVLRKVSISRGRGEMDSGFANLRIVYK